MGQFAQKLKPVRRMVLVQVVIWGVVFGCFSFTKAASVSAKSVAQTPAQTPAAPAQTPAQTPAPGSQQTPVAASTAAASAALPDGPGKDELLRVCTKCHSATQVMAKRQDRQGWEDTITKMAGMGATASDEEFSAILDYLVKNYGPAPAAK